MVERHVVPSPSGGWVVRAPVSGRPSGHYDRDDAAVARARQIVERRGGGLVVVHDRAGEVAETLDVPAGEPRSNGRKAGGGGMQPPSNSPPTNSGVPNTTETSYLDTRSSSQSGSHFPREVLNRLSTDAPPWMRKPAATAGVVVGGTALLALLGGSARRRRHRRHGP